MKDDNSGYLSGAVPQTADQQIQARKEGIYMTASIGGSALQAFAGKRILAVEDEAMIAMLIEEMLDELGFEQIWICASVAEAIALLGEKQPDVALLDLNLKGEKAFPVAVRLREIAVPIVFASGYGRSGLTADWADCRVLEKPYTLDGLEAALTAVLARPSLV